MTAREVYEIRCDADGCPARFLAGEVADTVRAAAKTAGWSRIGWGDDLCPDHSP